MNYKVYPCLDKRNLGKDGRYPAKIAIGYNRKTDYVSTGVYCTEEEWGDVTSLSPSNSVKEKHKTISNTQDKVLALVNTMVNYDIKTIRKLASGLDMATPVSPRDKLHTAMTNVFDWFDLKIKELEEEKEAFGTADNYRDSKSFYAKHTNLTYVDFGYFTKSKLFEIQKAAMSGGMSKANIHRHARHLRHIFNIAILERVIDKDIYPFHKRGYVIPQTRKAKKALNRSDISILIRDLPESNDERMALDFFIFSYYGNGMNMKDVAYLEYDFIYGNTLRFKRKKTENTSTEAQSITVAITEEMWQIIRRYGRNAQEGFIFSIIKQHDTPKQQRIDYRNFNRVVNNNLKAITKRLGLSIKVTHGLSRHSFATALKQEGVSTDYISEALGHSNKSVTQHYLSSFEDDIVNSNADKLRRYASRGGNDETTSASPAPQV